MPLFKFRNPFRVSGSTGFLVSNTDVIDGLTKQSVALSIGQDVETTSDVVFNDINQPTSVIIGTPAQNIVLSYASISGSITQTFGDSFVVSESLSALSDMSVIGNITAQKIEATLTGSQILYDSGSSKFGDTVNDTHEVTGSMLFSGSFELNNYSVDEISADTTGVDENTTALIVEDAAKELFSGVSSQNDFIRQKFAHKGSVQSGATASFTAVTASAPTGLVATTEDDFMFFNNGMIIEYDALTIEQSGSKFLLKVNPTGLGYGLDSNDEIVAWGKFNSPGYLDFDGLTNEVTTAFSGSSAAPVNKTYSWWMKATETAVNKGVFGYGSDKREAFLINHSQSGMGKPVIRLANHMYKYFMTPGHEEDGGGTSGNADGGADEATAHISAQDDGLWHHWMLFSDPSDPENSKLYIDGVEQDTAKFANTGATNTLQDSLTIGAVDSSTTTGEHFGGSIREFSVFSGDKTGNALKYWNNGAPYNVTNESDLQGYWKMYEGTGTTVLDSSGEGNHGTIDGASWNNM